MFQTKATTSNKINLSVYPSIRLYVYTSIRLFVYSSIRLYVYTSILLFVYSSIRLSVYPSIRLSIYPSIYPSRDTLAELERTYKAPAPVVKDTAKADKFNAAHYSTGR